MIPTKFNETSNQDLSEMLGKMIVAKDDSGRYVLEAHPSEVSEMIQEVKNRLESLDDLLEITNKVYPKVKAMVMKQMYETCCNNCVHLTYGTDVTGKRFPSCKECKIGLEPKFLSQSFEWCEEFTKKEKGVRQ